MPTTLNVESLRGVWVDMLVPLQENLAIDQAKLAGHARNLSAKGLENFVLFGQGGEGFAFSGEEKLSALTHLLSSGVDAKNIMLGIQSSSFIETAEQLRKAHEQGIRQFLIAPPQPYGQSFSHTALAHYFQELIKRVNLNDWRLFIHQLGGTSRDAELSEMALVDLKKSHPQTFAGIVDQDVHVNHTVELMRSFGSDRVVVPCHEPNLLVLKSKVCVSMLANILPITVHNITTKEFVNSATKIAGMKEAKPDDRVNELMSIIGDNPSIASLKLFLSIHYRMDGWEGVRPPQSELSKEARQNLMVRFKTFNLQVHE